MEAQEGGALRNARRDIEVALQDAEVALQASNYGHSVSFGHVRYGQHCGGLEVALQGHMHFQQLNRICPMRWQGSCLRHSMVPSFDASAWTPASGHTCV